MRYLVFAFNLACVFSVFSAPLFAQDMLRPVAPKAQLTALEASVGQGPSALTDAALTTGKGTSTADIQLVQYWLDYGYKRSIPFWLGTSLPTNSKIDKNTVVDSLLSPTGGLLYLGVTPTDDEGKLMRQWRGYTGSPPAEGICYFAKDNTQGNGCFWWYRYGAKVSQTPVNANNDTQYFPAAYAGLGGHVQFPITNADHQTGAGLALAGLSINAGLIDASKLEFAFGRRPSSAFLTADAELKIQIDKQFSIKGGATLGNTNHLIGTRAFLTFKFEH